MRVSASTRMASRMAACAVLATGVAVGATASAETRLTLGITSNLSTVNPYGDSASHLYGLWGEIYGNLCRYSFEKGGYVGHLAEKWEVKDENTWIFHLKKGMKFHDGTELTAKDVVHSFFRMSKDPESSQKQNSGRKIKSVEAVDDYTVRMISHKPTSSLLSYICGLWAISSKDAYDKYGAKEADKNHPYGAGPYRLKEFVIGNRMVLEKAEGNPFLRPGSPDIVIVRKMTESEQRVTALLNGEIQIAQFIPPHLLSRIEKSKNARLVPTSSVELMFLAMNPDMKPWDNKKVRQAVCHAINREGIVKALLKGQAQLLQGPIGPGQYAHDPNHKPVYDYNPEKAKKLLAEAGYGDGVEVDFYTPVGRYVNDKQITQAMVPMLGAVGIKAKLHTPEWVTQWANVRKGKVPFFYQGRGSVIDPGPALSQYFETGVSPRIKFSHAEYDRLMQAERAAFDEQKRIATLRQAMSVLTEEAPACFMWTHTLQYGVANNVDYQPRPDGRPYMSEATMKN